MKEKKRATNNKTNTSVKDRHRNTDRQINRQANLKIGR